MCGTIEASYIYVSLQVAIEANLIVIALGGIYGYFAKQNTTLIRDNDLLERELNDENQSTSWIQNLFTKASKSFVRRAETIRKFTWRCGVFCCVVTSAYFYGLIWLTSPVELCTSVWVPSRSIGLVMAFAGPSLMLTMIVAAFFGNMVATWLNLEFTGRANDYKEKTSDSPRN